MEFIAIAVLGFVGILLSVTTITMYHLVSSGQTEIFGSKVVAFAGVLTAAYYLSLIILLL